MTSSKAIDAPDGASTMTDTNLSVDNECWLDLLLKWRAVLCTELLAIRFPIRNAQVKARSDDLIFSIKCVDFGPEKTLKDTGHDLASLRLGQLMRESGYQDDLPWHGSLRDLEKRTAGREQRIKKDAR